MDKITDEVYMYMLDDISKDLYRAKNKFIDIVKHLEEHPTLARFGSEKARTTLEEIKTVLSSIDDLPVLPYESTKD